MNIVDLIRTHPVKESLPYLPSIMLEIIRAWYKNPQVYSEDGLVYCKSGSYTGRILQDRGESYCLTCSYNIEPHSISLKDNSIKLPIFLVIESRLEEKDSVTRYFVTREIFDYKDLVKSLFTLEWSIKGVLPEGHDLRKKWLKDKSYEFVWGIIHEV